MVWLLVGPFFAGGAVWQLVVLEIVATVPYGTAGALALVSWG
jgi:hypothetical protein